MEGGWQCVIVGLNQSRRKPFFAQWHCHRVFGGLPLPTNYLMGKKSHSLPTRCLILSFYGCTSLPGNLGLNVDSIAVSLLCFFASLNQSTHELRPPNSGKQCVHFDWITYISPAALCGCSCLFLEDVWARSLRIGMALCHPGSEFLPFLLTF